MRLKTLLIASCLSLSILFAFHLFQGALKELKSTRRSFTTVQAVTARANPELKKIKPFARELYRYAVKRNYNTAVGFVIDMRIPSGKKRFFVYDLSKDTVKYSGLVAHGSCNTNFLYDAKFSNEAGCGCSSSGKYRIEYKYTGRFGLAYKLTGLDSSNSNASKRSIVLHGYSCVPDNETYPMYLCNSLGCPMVSYKFLDKLAKEIKASKKSILLWIIN